MIIHIQAKDSGKFVEITDNITQTVVFAAFLEIADGVVDVNVASPDGEEGKITIMKGPSSPPNTISKSNYPVKAGETIPISDGQD